MNDVGSMLEKGKGEALEMLRDEGLHRSFYLCILSKPHFSIKRQLQWPRPLEHYEISPPFSPAHHGLERSCDTKTL